MSTLLIIAFLFFIGSVLGWLLELIFRRFFSRNNPDHKWINPGFCVGPYVPLYGSGLSILYILATVGSACHFTDSLKGMLIMFVIMSVSMTAIEYLAGILLLKFFHLRLWDYSREWGNIQGLICPKFSLAWALLGAMYYFLIHPNVLEALYWLSENLQFSFFIGLFFGFFIIDVAYSGKLVIKVKNFAKENDLIVHLEEVKLHMQQIREERKLRKRFFLAMHSEIMPFQEYLQSSYKERIKMQSSYKERIKSKWDHYGTEAVDTMEKRDSELFDKK